MKRSLFKRFSILVLLMVILITLATTLNFYDGYKDFHERKLLDILDFLKNMNLEDAEHEKEFDAAKKSFRGIRITLVDTNGNVIYDTDEAASKMESHSTRKEIVEAKDLGKGSDIRKSDTLGENFYYFATRLSNGNILRVSEMQKNIFSSFKDSIIPVVFILFIGLLIAFFSINHVSNKLVENLKDQFTAISHGESLDSEFPELYPIKRIVRDQQDELNERLDDLKEYRDTNEIIFRNMQDGFLFIDNVNRVEMINSKAIFLLGKEKNEGYMDKSVFYLIRDEKLIEILGEKDSKREEKIEVEIEDRKLLITIDPVLVSDNLVGRIIVIRDVTEESILERERREFTSNVTHELKTPLTSINGYAEMLTNNMVKNEDVPKVGNMILKSGNRMLTLVEKILSLSKVEEQKNNKKEEINVKELISDVVNTINSKAQNKNISITTELDEVRYTGVREVLEETVYNLVDNAVKYGKYDGKVWVKLVARDKGFKFIVKDDGIGIDDLDREKIFQRFYTADKSRNSADASGIGLSIVKHGVEVMGGTVILESKLGVGSTFEVFIPYNIV